MRIGQFTIAATLSILALAANAPGALAQQAEAMK